MANGDIVKMGMLIDHEYRLPRKASKDNDWFMSSNTYRTNYDCCNFTFATATEYEKNHDMEWKWIEAIVGGTKMYISTTMSFVAYPIEYYYGNIYNRYVCIDNNYYLFKLLSLDQWESLPSSVLNKIDWKSSSGGTLQTLTTSDAGSNRAYTAGYNTSTGTWDTSTYQTQDSSISDTGCIPVLQPITSGTVKMGTLTTPDSGWHVSFDNSENLSTYILYDTTNPIADDYFTPKWFITTLNGKKILICNYIIHVSCVNCNKYKDRIVYFDGNKFKIKALTLDEWKSLPSSILNQVSSIADNSLIFTSSLDSNSNCIYFTYSNGSFATTSFNPSNNSVVGGFLFVLEYMGTGPDNIKLGALVDSSGNIVTPKKYSSQDFPNADECLPNYSFTNTTNENLKWSWIKTNINGDTVLISKFVTGPSRYDTLLSNGMIGKTYILDNNKYQMVFLTPAELNTLDYATLYNIDFGYANSSPWNMFTNSKSGTSIQSLRFSNDSNFGDGLRSKYKTEESNTNYSNSGYYATLKLISSPPTISGVDSNLGDKTQAFSIEYTVDDPDTGDSLTVSCKLNGTTYVTINNAIRNQKYNFEINSSMFANLSLYETNTIEISVTDGMATTTRTYTFRKTNTAPVINYTGSTNLGLISGKPTINYSVTDAEGDEITITERLNGKVLQTYTVSSGTECTVQISNLSWLGCGNSTNTIEINARDAAGGSSNLTITFVRAIDRIEVITNPIKTDKAVTKISLEVGWNTEGASGQVFVCNNGYDASPTWENMTGSVGSNTVYNLTNTTKTASDWGVSVKVIVKKDGGSTGEVSLYSIKGTYE